MRVQIVDPPAFTPPYDRALCAALAAAGAEVELVTSHFEYGPVPAARRLRGRRALLPPLGRARRPQAAAGAAACASPSTCRGCGACAPTPAAPTSSTCSGSASPTSTASCCRTDRARSPSTTRCQRSALRRRRQRALLSRMDALVAHSEYGAGRAARRWSATPPGSTRSPTAPSTHLTRPGRRGAAAGGARRGRGAGGPLLRPDPPVQGRRRAARGVSRRSRAPSCGSSACRGWTSTRCARLAERCRATVRFVPRFITDREIPAYFRRADLVALPYRAIEQSGVLYTALAFGNAIVASSVGGFTEVGERDGALRLVPPGDAGALREALGELLGDEGERSALAAAAANAAAPVLVGPHRRADARPLSRARRRDDRRRDHLLGRAPARSSTRTSATRWRSGCSPAAASLQLASVSADASRISRGAAAGLADRRRPRRGGRDRREGRPMRWRSTTRGSCSRSSSPPTAPPTAPSSSPAQPAPTTSSTSSAAGKLLDPERRRRRGDGRASSRSATPTRPGSRTRSASSSPPFADPQRRLRLRPGALHRPGRLERGGRLLALRARGARSMESRPRRDHRRQRRDLRGAQVGLPRRSAPRRATTSSSRSCCTSAGCARSTCPTRSPRRRWSRRTRASSRASGG